MKPKGTWEVNFGVLQKGGGGVVILCQVNCIPEVILLDFYDFLRQELGYMRKENIRNFTGLWPQGAEMYVCEILDLEADINDLNLYSFFLNIIKISLSGCRECKVE